MNMYNLTDFVKESQPEEPVCFNALADTLEFGNTVDVTGHDLETLLKLQDEACHALNSLVAARDNIDSLDMECITSVTAFETMLKVDTFNLYQSSMMADEDKDAKKGKIRKAIERAVEVTRNILQKIFKQVTVWFRQVTDVSKRKVKAIDGLLQRIKEFTDADSYQRAETPIDFTGAAGNLASPKGELVAPDFHPDLANQLQDVDWKKLGTSTLDAIKESITDGEVKVNTDETISKIAGPLFGPHPEKEGISIVSVRYAVGAVIEVSGFDPMKFTIVKPNHSSKKWGGKVYTTEQIISSLNAAKSIYESVRDIDDADIEKEAMKLINDAKKEENASPETLREVTSMIRQQSDFTFKFTKLSLMYADGMVELCRQSLSRYSKLR